MICSTLEMYLPWYASSWKFYLLYVALVAWLVEIYVVRDRPVLGIVPLLL